MAKDKTEVILLNEKRVPRGFSFDFGGHPISPGKGVRYLGVTFDSRRKFRQHVINVTTKAVKYTGVLSHLATNLGGPSMATRKLYQAVIESVVLYAASIWRGALEDEVSRRHLKRAQSLGPNRVVCAYRTVSYDALCVLAGEPPITLKVVERAHLYSRTHKLQGPRQTRAISGRS